MSSKLPQPNSRSDAEVQCTITKIASVDREGRPAFGEKSEELCFVLKVPGEDADISARIGSSPDLPSTPPGREDAILLLRIATQADVNDTIDVAGLRLTVKAISPSYDSVGKLTYFVVQATICEIAPDS